ncbi:hypothetical protein AB0873_10705 [Micromonospora sp. NPDC047707]|uniref:hypothetical protein n=1 Tax=unclassified Micromonospora TaxID=2617518 RepID=UPI001E4B463B|nr:hypothetical protein [Micromonospora sp. WMMC415]
MNADDGLGGLEELFRNPTGQMGRRGRRARRTRIAAGVASAVAVAAVVGGAAAVAGRPVAAPPLTPAADAPAPSVSPRRTTEPSPSADGPTPSPSRSGTARPSSGTPPRPVPARAMLQLADLPDDFRSLRSDVSGDWPLESLGIHCRDASPSLLVGEVHRRDVRYDSPTDVLIERVTRHAGDAAVTVMGNARRFVAGCVPTRPDDSLTVLAEGLGGAESLLVGSVIEDEPGRLLLVRQGDLVAQVRLDGRATRAEARSYARAVASRLCAGTDAC